MIAFESGLYVRIQECASAPAPYPLKSGFTEGRAYRVVGAFNASETSEAYFVLANDSDQLWFISNRHLRFVGVSKEYMEPRFDIPENKTHDNDVKKRPDFFIIQ